MQDFVKGFIKLDIQQIKTSHILAINSTIIVELTHHL